MNHSIRIAVVLIAGLIGFGTAAQAQSDPPGRVGRLAFIEGTVSFHDDQQSAWSPAVVNTPLTSGDAIWTEPNARSELSVAGTRVRMDNGTQLDMLAIDDSQTRLQIDRGRIDIKTFTLDTRTPYLIITPRGTITLQQQGDYYVEAGSTEDATRLGVRSGAAQIQSLNGQVLAVRAGEVGEISGDVGTPQLRTVNGAPPPPVPYWAVRDQQVSYDTPAQYLSSGVTGYEDLNAYGSWTNDSQYGNVWSPRSVPSGWQPYRTGHWSNVRPWGWTWIDDQPWGYAPYHYGRWANVGNRWVWVPPQRDVQPVYAPALVAFIGGVELAVTLGNQNNSPVGWFPLGPRETYVPSYSTNRDYYNRINQSAQIQPQVLESRWQAAQRREAFVVGQNSVLVNQRFATVVPADTFVRSQPVARAALTVAPEKLAAAPVAFVAAPPAPTASLAATTPAKPTDSKAPTDPKAQADAKARADAQVKAGAQANVSIAKTAVGDMPTLGKPAPTQPPAAPGPKIAIAPNTPATIATPNAAPGRPATPATPALVPRTGSAPPPLNDKAPGTPPKPGQPEAKAPAANDNKATPATPATPAAPAVKAEPAKPAPTVATPATPATSAAPAAKVEPPKAELAKPAPSVAAPATPATPAAPASKPEATRPAPVLAPQTGQHPEPAREPKKDSGASNNATPLPSHPASPPAQATPGVAAPAPQPTGPPPQVVTPASQQHAKPAAPAPAAIPPQAPPPHVVAAPPPPAKAAAAPVLTEQEQKNKEK